MNLLAIIWFLVVIMTVVFIHELGHFSVARFFGVKIDVFSIGFGKKLFSWMDSRGTRWCVCLIPLGGYVKMHGDVMPKDESIPPPDGEDLFINKPLWQKAGVVLAGPLANYILAIAILAFILLVNGQTMATNEVTNIKDGGPAAIAGVEVGDIIVEADGHSIENLSDIHAAASMHIDISTPLEIEVIRHSARLRLDLFMVFDPSSKRNIVGLGFTKTITESLSPVKSLVQGTVYVGKTSVLMLEAIWQMLTGKRSTDDLGSIGKIADYTTKSMEYGWVMMLTSIALLSLNLGLLNLLPIPVLDGGHLLYYAIQAVIRRPIPYKVQVFGMKLGLFLVFALMAVGIVNDIKEFILH